MSLSVRQSLVLLAREFDALVICDDVYDLLYWNVSNDNHAKKPVKAIVPRLVDVDATLAGGSERPGADGFGNVMSNGSFSKIVAPGTRTGWAEGRRLTYVISLFTNIMQARPNLRLRWHRLAQIDQVVPLRT
jgi:DNA-binding transcriptional MocR family regulator